MAMDNATRIQNFAARIISGARKFDHISPVHRELWWLPVTPACKTVIISKGRCFCV